MDIGEMFQFEECDNGYVLKNFLLKDDASVTELEIPSKCKGKPVISIGQKAFSEAKYLCLIKISEGIKEIGANAFYFCTALKSVILPDSLKAIRTSAFDVCMRLKTVLFPSGLELIDGFAFHYCENIKSAILPSDLINLGKGAFGECRRLESVVFNEKLEYIGPFAFRGCRNLKSAVLPKKIKSVKDSLFGHCSNLENIEFPDGLEEIGDFAFVNCGLRSVTFPQGLRKIGQKAFMSCSKLEKAVFQNSTTSLWSSVFSNCPKLAAENVIQALAHSSDVTKAFSGSERFDWNSALRDDVFALALKYDSFALFDKENVFVEIVERNLCRFLPLCENAGWDISEEFLGELLDISLDNGFTEITAWLLDYKNRKFGFGKV